MKAIKLPFLFDSQKLQNELTAIAKSFESIHSVRIKENALNGIHLIIPTPENRKNEKGYTYSHTKELNQSPYLQSVLDTFQCDKNLYRVHNLRPKGKIDLHTDVGSGLSNKIVRLQIPVTTNDEVYFWVDGERIIMQSGECWLVDITQPHEVENKSEKDRLKLLIDCDLNDWWKAILTKHGLELEAYSEWNSYSLDALHSMKENILRMEVDVNNELV